MDTCGDADDVFFDVKRRRIYVSCGSGSLDIIQQDDTGSRTLTRIATRSGARTSLYVPELDRLFVAARAGPLGIGASILVFRPKPDGPRTAMSRLSAVRARASGASSGIGNTELTLISQST